MVWPARSRMVQWQGQPLLCQRQLSRWLRLMLSAPPKRGDAERGVCYRYVLVLDQWSLREAALLAGEGAWYTGTRLRTLQLYNNWLSAWGLKRLLPDWGCHTRAALM